jgi:hypothetical protein
MHSDHGLTSRAIMGLEFGCFSRYNEDAKCFAAQCFWGESEMQESPYFGEGHVSVLWLRYDATCRKDAGSRPDEVNEIVFNLPNPSGHTRPGSSLSL